MKRLANRLIYLPLRIQLGKKAAGLSPAAFSDRGSPQWTIIATFS